MAPDKLLASTAVKDRRPPIDTKAAAIYTGSKPNYLEKLRCTGGGPVFIKRKGVVKYDPDDLMLGLRPVSARPPRRRWRPNDPEKLEGRPRGNGDRPSEFTVRAG